MCYRERVAKKKERSDAYSSFPPTVNDLAAILLPLLEDRGRPSLRNVDSVHVAARLNAEARARASGWQTFDSRHVDVLARVELEAGLCRVNLEVDLGVWVVGGDDLLEGRGARVERDGLRVGVDHEAVVNIGFFFAEGERGVGLHTGVFFDGTSWDTTVVDDLVLIRNQGDFGASNG
jgi:hypothetical protein